MIFLIEQTAQKNVVSDELIGTIITAIVTILVAVVGFVVTNISICRELKNDLKKSRDDVMIQNMEYIPRITLNLLDYCLGKSDIQFESSYDNLLSYIYGYGTEKVIKLAVHLQEVYNRANSVEEFDVNEVVCTYVLIITQTKFDIMGIYINPENWLKLKVPNYRKQREHFKNINNAIVKNLKLNRKLLIK